jgi:hypothetical protein
MQGRTLSSRIRLYCDKFVPPVFQETDTNRQKPQIDGHGMYLVVIAWVYVALMMAVVEATSPQGTLLGAFFTLLLYGAVPVSLILYFIARRKPRAPSGPAPDAGGLPATAAQAPAVTPVREKD